jgi:tetrahydromethanopterin S-methyltransferase subunit B
MKIRKFIDFINEELNILMEESVKVIDKRINSENKILLELIKLNTSSLEDKINSLENKVNLLENQLKPPKKSIVKVCYNYFVTCIDFIYACMLIILLIALYLPHTFLLS